MIVRGQPDRTHIDRVKQAALALKGSILEFWRILGISKHELAAGIAELMKVLESLQMRNPA